MNLAVLNVEAFDRECSKLAPTHPGGEGESNHGSIVIGHGFDESPAFFGCQGPHGGLPDLWQVQV